MKCAYFADFCISGNNIKWNKTAYVDIEDKSHQWFGATVQSSGENGVIVVSAANLSDLLSRSTLICLTINIFLYTTMQLEELKTKIRTSKFELPALESKQKAISLSESLGSSRFFYFFIVTTILLNVDATKVPANLSDLDCDHLVQY